MMQTAIQAHQMALAGLTANIPGGTYARQGYDEELRERASVLARESVAFLNGYLGVMQSEFERRYPDTE